MPDLPAPPAAMISGIVIFARSRVGVEIRPDGVPDQAADPRERTRWIRSVERRERRPALERGEGPHLPAAKDLPCDSLLRPHDRQLPDEVASEPVRAVVGRASFIRAESVRILRHTDFAGRWIEDVRRGVDVSTPRIVQRGAEAVAQSLLDSRLRRLIPGLRRVRAPSGSRRESDPGVSYMTCRRTGDAGCRRSSGTDLSRTFRRSRS